MFHINKSLKRTLQIAQNNLVDTNASTPRQESAGGSKARLYWPTFADIFVVDFLH